MLTRQQLEVCGVLYMVDGGTEMLLLLLGGMAKKSWDCWRRKSTKNGKTLLDLMGRWRGEDCSAAGWYSKGSETESREHRLNKTSTRPKIHQATTHWKVGYETEGVPPWLKGYMPMGHVLPNVKSVESSSALAHLSLCSVDLEKINKSKTYKNIGPSYTRSCVTLAFHN